MGAEQQSIPTFAVIALRPERLAQYRAASQLTRPARPKQDYRVTGGVAVVPVHGALEKHENFLSWFLGDTTFESLQEQLREIAHRDDVHSVLLDIDSPGGTVAGTFETAQMIKTLSSEKPVWAFCSGDVCSAAYWLASAATRIVVTPSTEVGGIGVVGIHVDTSKMEEMLGLTYTEVTSGEYKRINSQHAPLSEAGREYLQGLVDSHASVFYSTVSTNRGLTGEALDTVTDGRVFLGEQAVQLGLADSVDTFDNTLTKLLGGQKTMTTVAETSAINLDEVRAEERTRIQEILGLAPLGLEAEARSFCFDNPVSSADAAKAFLKLAKERNAHLLSQHVADAPTPVDASVEQTEEQDPWATALANAVNKFNQ